LFVVVGLPLDSNVTFQSFRLFELVTETDDRERAYLSRRKMTRLLAPTTLENPIFLHLTNVTGK